MTFSDLFRIMRRFWALSAAVLLATVGGALAVLLLPTEEFESTSSVVVQPATAGSLSFGATEAVQYLLPPTVTRARSEAFKIDVRHHIPTPRHVPLAIAAENDPGTAIITLTARSTDRVMAFRGAVGAALELIRRPTSGYVVISLLEPASKPESIRSERALPILFGAIVLGIILALFSALAANAIWRRLPPAREIPGRLGVAVLGEIPRARSWPATTAELYGEPRHRKGAEAVERLAAAVQRVAGDAPTVGVVSWADGEGRTTVTAGVAHALARFGSAVTAVDLDFRDARLHDALGVDAPAEPGSGDDFPSTCRQTAIDLLAICPAPAAVEHPVRAVRARLDLLAQWDPRDTIVIDMPPMLTAEAPLIAAACDGVVVVVDVRRRTPSDVEQMLHDLRSAGVTVLGLVLNRSRRTRSRRERPALRASPGPVAGAGVESPEPA